MTMFGLKEAEVAGIVRAVAGDHLDRDAIETRFATAAWSCIAEPGDRVAGALVRVVGAARALTGLLGAWGTDRWAAELGAASIELGPEDVRAALDRWTPRLRSGATTLALTQAARFGVAMRTPDDPDWPVGFTALGDHAPLTLWVRGRTDAFRSFDRAIALVGARAATGYGEHVATESSAGLVDRGYAIVSGGAYGVDGTAHRAALASHGVTMAFMAGGVDRFYPSGHEALLARIVDSGCVISELPCGAAPTKWRFLQRNRLIAAASLATIVIEAGWRSGTLNTAHHAQTIGRPVGAVPGPVTSPASAGCHRLIRGGASLVTSADEMAALAPLGPIHEHQPRYDEHDPDAVRVLDALSSRTARLPEQIAARAGLSADSARAALGRLTLEGWVRSDERGFMRARTRASDGGAAQHAGS